MARTRLTGKKLIKGADFKSKKGGATIIVGDTFSHPDTYAYQIS